MHLIIGYSTIFGVEKPNVNELLAGIPSKYIIGVLSTFSNAIERTGDARLTQWELLDAISVNFPEALKNDIVTRLIKFEQAKGSFSIFANRYIVEMIQREYLDYRTEESVEFNEDPGALELNIFKAYTLIVDEVAIKDNDGLEERMFEAKKHPESELYRMTWPYFAKQFEFSAGPDHVFEGFKGMALLNFLLASDKYRDHLQHFFASVNRKNGVDYIGRMMHMIRTNLLHEGTGSPDDHFIQFQQDSSDPWVQLLTMNPEILKKDGKKQLDYVGMKERPIFLFEEDRYLIPYWKYLYSSLYPGLLFTIFRQGGIDKKESFGDFKQWLGLHFSEQFLFRNLIDYCFANHSVVRYYEKALNPDCFMRKGRNLFVFEFKDNLITADTIQSLSYDKFKGTIDKAFIESDNSKGVKPKGISQLARLIELLIKDDQKGYLTEEIVPAGLSLSQMNIYPIIVYTNFYFDMPGVNDYLEVEFNKRFGKLGLANMKCVTLINFQYFFERMIAFADQAIFFKDELELYWQHVAERKNHAMRTGIAEDRMASMPSFMEWATSNSTSYLDHRRDHIVSEVMTTWKISDEAD